MKDYILRIEISHLNKPQQTFSAAVSDWFETTPKIKGDSNSVLFQGLCVLNDIRPKEAHEQIIKQVTESNNVVKTVTRWQDLGRWDVAFGEEEPPT